MKKTLLLNGQQAAEEIGVYPNQMAQLRRQGLPWMRLPGCKRYRYPREALEEWIRERTEQEEAATS